MATEASTAVPALPLSGQMVRKSCPWDAAEIHCAGCGRRVSRAAGEEPEGQAHSPACLASAPYGAASGQEGGLVAWSVRPPGPARRRAHANATCPASPVASSPHLSGREAGVH